MARAISAPGGAGAGGVGPWLIPAAAALALAGAGALWVAGGIASLIAGAGWVWPPFALTTFIDVIRTGTASAWPAADPRVLAVCAALLAAIVVVPGGIAAVVFFSRQPAADDPRRSLARSSHLAAMLPRAAAARAIRLRPTLAKAKAKDLLRVDPGQVGVALGHLGRAGKGPAIFASFEDVAVAFMAPRSGKTTALAVPIVLAAPGAVVLTSNKTEGWKETAALRAARTGERVWVFDPQSIARARQDWWWNPLANLTSVADASRLAGHFVTTVEGEKKDIWGPAAKELLANLLLAAAVSGHTLVDVYEWLADEATPVPRGILAEAGYELIARTLRSTQDSPPETRGSVYFTARAATQCLRDAAITAWVTPPHPEEAMVAFDPTAFPTTAQTLYLLSKDEGGSAGPLVAALTDAVLRAGVRAAEQRAGRLDPPMVLVLDEAANICRIADLPALYSHLGSRGIVPLTILQSYSQAEGVWGATGTKALWGAATIKLIGAGMDDASFAEDISKLVGDHDVATISHSTGSARGGGPSSTRTTRSQRILPPARIRALPKGSALLLATGIKPAMLTLAPWYDGPNAAQITAAAKAAEAGVAQRAREQALTPGGAR